MTTRCCAPDCPSCCTASFQHQSRPLVTVPQRQWPVVTSDPPPPRPFASRLCSTTRKPSRCPASRPGLGLLVLRQSLCARHCYLAIFVFSLVFSSSPLSLSTFSSLPRPLLLPLSFPSHPQSSNYPPPSRFWRLFVSFQGPSPPLAGRRR